jgi:hypothetical protein
MICNWAIAPTNDTADAQEKGFIQSSISPLGTRIYRVYYIQCIACIVCHLSMVRQVISRSTQLNDRYRAGIWPTLASR